MQFIPFYFCGSFLPSWIQFGIRIANLDPDPGTPLNTGPIRIRIHNSGCCMWRCMCSIRKWTAEGVAQDSAHHECAHASPPPAPCLFHHPHQVRKWSVAGSVPNRHSFRVQIWIWIFVLNSDPIPALGREPKRQNLSRFCSWKIKSLPDQGIKCGAEFGSDSSLVSEFSGTKNYHDFFVENSRWEMKSFRP